MAIVSDYCYYLKYEKEYIYNLKIIKNCIILENEELKYTKHFILSNI